MPDLLERVADALSVPDDGSCDGSRAVEGVREILAAVGIPVLRDVGVSENALDQLTERTMSDFFITQSPVPWTDAEVRAIFAAALGLASRSAANVV